MRFWKLFGLVCSLAAALSTGGAWALSDPPKSASSSVDPFVGTWRHLVGGREEGLCEEVYRYDAAGTSEESSGLSRTKSLWRIEGGTDATAFRRLRIEIREHNGQRDCSGGLPPVAKPLSFLVRVHPSGRWAELCSTQSERRQCMVFWRTTP